MKPCPNCRQKLPEIYRYCTQCGAALDGFEGLAIADGVCKNLVAPPPPPPRQSPTEIPALGSWGLAALTLALTALGVLALRRRT